jgi:hypothetical protein
MRTFLLVVIPTLFAACSGDEDNFSFFISSAGNPNGGDFRRDNTETDGLAGADDFCKAKATAAVPGSANRQWRAYLSTDTVNAKDRIGTGPWYNAKGEKIADDVAALHGDASNLTKETALNEKGEVINGRGDTPNRHDILTGSLPDGTAAPETCGNWTMGGAEGAAIVGHSDRTGLDDSAAAKSWNSSHATRGGCTQEAFKGTGGDGLFYCFAAN